MINEETGEEVFRPDEALLQEALKVAKSKDPAAGLWKMLEHITMWATRDPGMFEGLPVHLPVTRAPSESLANTGAW